MSTEIQQLHAIVHGRVQGVGFRDFTRRQARDLGLTGWVRNLPDGSVELTAEGPRASLDQLLVALYRGPSAARVTEINRTWNPAAGKFTGFEIRF